MIFTKSDVSTSDDQVEKLIRELNIHYRACIGSLIYMLSTRVDLIFVVHKLEKFSSNPGKVQSKGLVHLSRYISNNKTFCLKYYDDMNDAPLSDLSRQASIKTENQFMDFSDSSWKYCPDTGISTRAYITFYQGVPTDHAIHVPGPVYESSAESDYNAAYTARMYLAHFSMLIHELLNKNPDIVLEEDPLIILDSKSYVFMDKKAKIISTQGTLI